MRSRLVILALLLTVVAFAAGCGSDEPQVLRLATTTSTADSGLLDAILPDFEAEYNAQVDVVAVGTGQAIELGEAGDADVILVHARAKEDAFIAEGHGTARYDVMYNDFIIVGPAADPAGIKGMATAAEALAAIAAAEATFASRGDDSGTHTKEVALWDKAEVTIPEGAAWYKSLGQGMGETLLFANETGAYTLTDRGTFLAQQDSLPNLEVMVGRHRPSTRTATGPAEPLRRHPGEPGQGRDQRRTRPGLRRLDHLGRDPGDDPGLRPRRIRPVALLPGLGGLEQPVTYPREPATAGRRSRWRSSSRG